MTQPITQSSARPAARTPDAPLAQEGLRRRPRVGESLIQALLLLCGVLSILTTLGIVYELGSESLLFFTRQQWVETNKTLTADLAAGSEMLTVTRAGGEVHPGETLRLGSEALTVTAVTGSTLTVVRGAQGTTPLAHGAGADLYKARRVTLREFVGKVEWNPQIGKFGIWSLVSATLMTSLIALVVALPLGLAVAIYLSEYAGARARQVLKPLLEVLAGVPTVVYGYFALTMMTPLLRAIFGQNTVEIYNTASAGLVIGILIIPLVSSMSEDALSAVPRSLREAAYALGATRLETAIKVVVPAALSGVAAAFILAASRAIGETMIVAIAAGAGPNFTINPFSAAETMTGHIVRISGGDLSYDSLDYNSLFAIGLVLFGMTLSLNILSQRIVRRFREVYE